jgi:cytochrome c peroxidase
MRCMYIILAGFCFLSFKQDAFIPLTYPNHFPKPVYLFSENELTAPKIALGRILFYDPILSADGSVSCASCHSPYNAFAHTDHALSHGIHDSIGTRNAPALFNLAWQSVFNWDGAVHHLDMQALNPITNPREMQESLTHVLEKLNHDTLYRAACYRAFGDSIMTSSYLLKSLSQFQLSLVSANSIYDRMKQGELAFNKQQQKGYALFQQYCDRCHTEPLFSSYTFASNHIPPQSNLHDAGRAIITQQPQDSFLFKIPTLRNLRYTYPYMHDGRFLTLSQVIHHYATAFDTPDKHGADFYIKLSSNDKADLIAFLHTLNDSSFVFNTNHHYPRQAGIPMR